MGESKTKVIVDAGRLDCRGLHPFRDQVAAERRFLIKTSEGHCLPVRCTPQDLEELALGQLFYHGCIQNARQIKEIEIVPAAGEIRVQMEAHCPAGEEMLRTQEESSRQAILEEAMQIQGDTGEMLRQTSPEEIGGLFQAAEEIFFNPGPLFVETGCAHACVLYRAGEVLCKREDIGRHNALDKVIGYALKEQLDLKQTAVFTTGRVSGDYMEKIIRSGIPTVVSRAAVTDEALRLARTHKVVLYGFVRKGTGNQYAPEL